MGHEGVSQCRTHPSQLQAWRNWVGAFPQGLEVVVFGGSHPPGLGTCWLKGPLSWNPDSHWECWSCWLLVTPTIAQFAEVGCAPCNVSHQLHALCAHPQRAQHRLSSCLRVHGLHGPPSCSDGCLMHTSEPCSGGAASNAGVQTVAWLQFLYQVAPSRPSCIAMRKCQAASACQAASCTPSHAWGRASDAGHRRRPSYASLIRV